MYHVELYARVRRSVMVEGMSVREASRVFCLHSVSLAANREGKNEGQ